MTRGDYKFIITRADVARDLTALAAEIRADDELFSTDKAELLKLIAGQFARIHARTPKPRP